METNSVPTIDTSHNFTGCCPKFDPAGWDHQTLHFKDKLFVRAITRSVAHVPLNMGRIFARVQEHIEEAGALDPSQALVLSRDLSPWSGEHLFAVTQDVDGEEMTTLTGDFVTRVFEGSYAKATEWIGAMKAAAGVAGHQAGRTFLFYTTCPKCAEAYGQNYVIGLNEI
jgi:hypothetical protein